MLFKNNIKRNKNQRSLLKDEAGASFVEYILLVGLIAMLAYLGFETFGASISTKITNMGGTVSGVPDAPQ